MRKRIFAPGSLDPTRARDMLPSPSMDELRQLRESGIARFGIVAAMTDVEGRILMVRHKRSAKTAAGMLGPLAETAKIHQQGNNPVTVEPSAVTLARGIHEELHVDQPDTLSLRARKLGSWAVHHWPVGGRFNGQTAFAVCPVVRLDADAREQLYDEFVETDETDAITFMNPHDIMRERNVRSGTHDWVNMIATSGLIRATNHRLRLPRVSRSAGEDAILENI